MKERKMLLTNKKKIYKKTYSILSYDNSVTIYEIKIIY